MAIDLEPEPVAVATDDGDPLTPAVMTSGGAVAEGGALG